MSLDAATLIAQACARITAAVDAAVDDSGLDAPVARLGRWRVRDVVQHLGGVHRWATRIVRTSSMDGPSFTKSRLDGEALLQWFDEGAGELVDTLRATSPTAPCPNFNPGSSATAAFWHRRQLHETTIHCWDVERALGQPCAIDSDVATDGIDEYLDVFVRTRGKQTLVAPLALRTSSADWTLRPSERAGRVDIARGIGADCAAELAGAADELLLVLWNRRTVAETGLTVTGDRSVAANFR